MTITEAAKLYGISTQAIYKRLKKQGVDVRSLKGKGGNLTEEGERLFSELFTHDTAPAVTDQKGQTARPEPETNQKPTAEDLTAEVERLKKQVEAMERDKAALFEALERTQQANLMILSQQQRPAIEPKKGLFARIADRFSHSRQDN